MIEQRSIPAPPWFFTDDTMMALSIVRTLAQHGCIDQDHPARSFGEKYDPSRGYGLAMHQLLPKLRRHRAAWRTESPALFGKEGSFGNGAAMRVAPLGAYFADDMGTLIEQAERSAVVTHCHREGIAGAIAIAVAAELAAQLTTEQESSCAAEFLERVTDKTPESEVRRGIQRAIKLAQATRVAEAVSILGNGTRFRARYRSLCPVGFGAPLGRLRRGYVDDSRRDGRSRYDLRDCRRNRWLCQPESQAYPANG